MAQPHLVEQLRDRLHRGIDAALLLGIGRDADANQIAPQKQAASRPSLLRHPGAFDVVGTVVLVKRGERQVFASRLVAAAASDAEDAILHNQLARGAQSHDGQLWCVGNCHDTDIRIEIEVQHLARHHLGPRFRIRPEDIDLDLRVVPCFAEDVPAGQDHRASRFAVDDRSRTKVDPRSVLNSQSHAGLKWIDGDNVLPVLTARHGGLVERHVSESRVLRLVLASEERQPHRRSLAVELIHPADIDRQTEAPARRTLSVTRLHFHLSNRGRGFRQFAQHLAQLLFGRQSGDAVNLLSVRNQHETRDRLHVEPRCQCRLLVDIDLANRQALTFELRHGGTHLLTRTTPRRGEVEQHVVHVGGRSGAQSDEDQNHRPPQRPLPGDAVRCGGPFHECEPGVANDFEP